MERAETVKEFRVDLHVHTALSPWAEAEMTPPSHREESDRIRS